MKKILLSLFSLCALGAHADEGMWTLYNLPNAVYEQMKAYGFQLPMEQLYASDNAVKNAVVNFGGFCTGVVVLSTSVVFARVSLCRLTDWCLPITIVVLMPSASTLASSTTTC